jgi:hypothetical protein|tara:strand:- start:987 stop:1121 length:135 start_codon:yes stop_codon:yes gene_type:complete
MGILTKREKEPQERLEDGRGLIPPVMVTGRRRVVASIFDKNHDS